MPAGTFRSYESFQILVRALVPRASESPLRLRAGVVELVQVAQVLGTLRRAVSAKRPSCLLCFDLSKAFDLLDWDKLAAKLKHRGFRGNFLLWHSEFVRGRSGKVQLDGGGRERRQRWEPIP